MILHLSLFGRELVSLAVSFADPAVEYGDESEAEQVDESPEPWPLTRSAFSTNDTHLERADTWEHPDEAARFGF